MPEATFVHQWLSRVQTLHASLARRGRTDLSSSVGLLLRILEEAKPAEADREIEDLVVRALVEVKACIAEPKRPFPPSLLLEMDVLLDARQEARQSESAAQSEVQGAPTATAAGEDDEQGWAAGMLSLLGNAQEADFDALVGKVRAVRRTAPRDELGTLREPLNRVGTALGAAPARVLMKGELHQGLLADLIQLFAQNCETGLLLIEGQGLSASIFFKKGLVVDASCGDETGEKGFFRSMHIREGRFSYQRGVETETVRIYRSAQHLIMDTLRLMDETA